jgi:hypothetical protein
MALLRYTLLRVLVFVALAALLWLVGLRGYGLLLTALVASGIVSVFALRRSRDRLSIVVDRRLRTIRTRMAERTGAEDAWNDAERQRTAEPRHSTGPRRHHGDMPR